MSQRELNQPQDFQKMCKQAERDHESKKLIVLIERVKRQLEDREQGSGPKVGVPKPPVAVLGAHSSLLRVPSRSALFER